MELRTLKYFLTVLQEGSITKAAKKLYITQPTLSRQLTELEQSLGRQLYSRSNKGIIPTEHGTMLANYAESIIALAEKAEADVSLPSETVSGSVYIGLGETKIVGIIADAMKAVHSSYPDIVFQLFSGTSSDLMDGLVRGQMDFLLECELQPHLNMNSLNLPGGDQWVAIMRSDDELASKSAITVDDLVDRTLIMSRQGSQVGPLRDWFGDQAQNLNVIATYNLPLNVKFLVEEGLGIALCYEGLIDGDTSLIKAVPLKPTIASTHGLVWRKSLPTRQAQVFLDALKRQLGVGL